MPVSVATQAVTGLGRRARDLLSISRWWNRTEAPFRQSIVAEGGSLDPKPIAPIWRDWVNSALRSREDVERAVRVLSDAGLAPHIERTKNWDALVALETIREATTPRAAVLEMGAEVYSPLLRWLYQYGYRSLIGVDLVHQERLRRGPIQLLQMDLTATTFRDRSFDAIACLSVIEHGVDPHGYFREAARLLRPGGVLVTSTDYWPDPVDTGGQKAFGQPIKVFDRPGIEALLEVAARHGFRPTGPLNLEVDERAVRWARYDLDYTFVVMVMQRPDDVASSAPRRAGEPT
jgi:SAM-dependent methyltransferase